MQIAEVQQREPIEGWRQRWQPDVVMTDLNIEDIAPTPLSHPRQTQRHADETVKQVPVFDMQEIAPLAETIRLMLGFHADALAQVRLSDSIKQILLRT